MAFCVICGRQHDPDVRCTDASGQALRDAGMPPPYSHQSDVGLAGSRSKRMVAYLVLAMAAVLALWWFVRPAH